MKKRMKAWYLNDALIQKVEASPERREWCESGAYEHFFDLEWKLPKDRKDRARVGALYVAEMPGTEGKNFWFFPVEGHKKILAPKSQITLFTKLGDIYYEGLWENCTEDLIMRETDFYLWLKPIENRKEAEISLLQKVKGVGRLLKHKLRGR